MSNLSLNPMGSFLGSNFLRAANLARKSLALIDRLSFGNSCGCCWAELLVTWLDFPLLGLWGVVGVFGVMGALFSDVILTRGEFVADDGVFPFSWTGVAIVVVDVIVGPS